MVVGMNPNLKNIAIRATVFFMSVVDTVSLAVCREWQNILVFEFVVMCHAPLPLTEKRRQHWPLPLFKVLYVPMFPSLETAKGLGRVCLSAELVCSVYSAINPNQRKISVTDSVRLAYEHGNLIDLICQDKYSEDFSE
jgi:hypothetical protein